MDHIVHRDGVLRGHVFQGRILENHIRRHVVALGFFASQVFEQANQCFVQHRSTIGFFIVDVDLLFFVIVIEWDLNGISLFQEIPPFIGQFEQAVTFDVFV